MTIAGSYKTEKGKIILKIEIYNEPGIKITEENAKEFYTAVRNAAQDKKNNMYSPFSKYEVKQ